MRRAARNSIFWLVENCTKSCLSVGRSSPDSQVLLRVSTAMNRDLSYLKNRIMFSKLYNFIEWITPYLKLSLVAGYKAIAKRVELRLK